MKRSRRQNAAGEAFVLSPNLKDQWYLALKYH